jgi:hypothetical protein
MVYFERVTLFAGAGHAKTLVAGGKSYGVGLHGTLRAGGGRRLRLHGLSVHGARRSGMADGSSLHRAGDDGVQSSVHRDSLAGMSRGGGGEFEFVERKLTRCEMLSARE